MHPFEITTITGLWDKWLTCRTPHYKSKRMRHRLKRSSSAAQVKVFVDRFLLDCPSWPPTVRSFKVKFPPLENIAALEAAGFTRPRKRGQETACWDGREWKPTATDLQVIWEATKSTFTCSWYVHCSDKYADVKQTHQILFVTNNLKVKAGKWFP